jgi:S1-C subfamily serine protease
MTGGPADKAGVLTRDRITRFAGKSVTTADAIRNLAGNLPADKPIKLTVQRGEEKREITLKTGEGL